MSKDAGGSRRVTGRWLGWAIASLGLVSTTGLAATALAPASSGSITTLKQGFNPQKVPAQFICGSAEGYPATIARTKRGEFPVIVWRSDYFSGAGWTPERRCQEVSARLQTYQSQGRLTYLAAGYMNNMPVICTVSSKEAQSCEGLVFTLQYRENSSETLEQHALARLERLRPMSSRATAAPLYESNVQRRPISIVTYFDMRQFLDAIE
jgi:hypothetical protein